MIGSLDGSTLAFVPFLMVLGTFQGARLRLVTRFLPTPRLQTIPDLDFVEQVLGLLVQFLRFALFRCPRSSVGRPHDRTDVRGDFAFAHEEAS